MGCISGAVWHSVRGFRHSPPVRDARQPAAVRDRRCSDPAANGTVLWPAQGMRLSGALSAVKIRAPVLGGNFAIWGGLFSSFECGMMHYRQREDPWNAIYSGALTGAVLAARGT